ncbi:MAG: RidA family protein [Desulfarculaceae bacterium]|nr:RidA family protein [Desulfarculaceae bacterium]
MSIHSDKAPAAIGPYSQARWAGDILYTSGQLGVDPASGEFVDGGVAGQARQALTNLGAVLEAADLGWGQVVKTTVFLTDMGDFAAVNEVYASFFEGAAALPARSCIAVAGLPRGGLVEVELVARR